MALWPAALIERLRHGLSDTATVNLVRMMRKHALAAAFLATTALTPQPASAGPLFMFVQGVVAGLVGAPILGGAGAAFLNGVIASTYISGFAATFAGRALLALGASALINALMPKPSLPSPSERFSTFAQSLTYMERGYGTIKKGGPFGFRSGIVDNKRHWTVTIAAHPTEGPVSHHLDLTEVTVDTDGDVLTDPMAGYVNLRTYTGDDAQQADPTLVAQFGGFTASHDFARHSYAALWAKRPPSQDALEIYTQGKEPDYAPVWRMANTIYDPRSGLTGWTDNWALCFAHELVNTWGRTVDWDRVAIEADVCDQAVINRDGVTQPRWTFNSSFSSNATFEDVTAQFLSAADGFLWERSDGLVDFYCGRWIEPTLTLVADDFLSLGYSRGNIGLNPATEYFAQYTEPANGWRETPSAAWVVDEDSPRVARALTIYGSASHNQTMRAIKPLVAADRADIKLRATVGLAVFEIIAGRAEAGIAAGLAHRFVAITHPLLPDTSYFEVTSLRLNADGFTGDIEMSQVTAASRSFDAASEEPAPPDYNNDEVSDSDAVDNITDLSGAAVSGTGGIAQIRWQWTAPDSSLTPVLRLRKQGEEWQEMSLTTSASEYTQTGLIDGQTYEAQIRARTAGYSTGDWKPDSPVSVVAVSNTTAPAAHTSFSTSVAGTTVTVDFTAPNDPNYYATRVYRADYSSGYSGPFDSASSALVRLEYGSPNAVDSWDDTALSSGVYAYWIAPINASGIEGTLTGPQTEEIF